MWVRGSFLSMTLDKVPALSGNRLRRLSITLERYPRLVDRLMEVNWSLIFVYIYLSEKKKWSSSVGLKKWSCFSSIVSVHLNVVWFPFASGAHGFLSTQSSHLNPVVLTPLLSLVYNAHPFIYYLPWQLKYMYWHRRQIYRLFDEQPQLTIWAEDVTEVNPNVEMVLSYCANGVVWKYEE